MADFEQLPDAVLYDWCSYNEISTLLALEPPIAIFGKEKDSNVSGLDSSSV